MALEKAGVEFIPEDDLKGPGVRLKERKVKEPAPPQVIRLKLGSAETPGSDKNIDLRFEVG